MHFSPLHRSLLNAAAFLCADDNDVAERTKIDKVAIDMTFKHEPTTRPPAGLKGLRAFQAVMSAGTVTAAAAKLNVAQSALTRLIANLEHDVGLILFQRSRKRLVPTEAAESFLVEVNRILSKFDEIPTIANQIRADAVTRLRIIVTPRLAASVVAPAAAIFAHHRPEIGLAIEMLPRAELERWAMREPFDLGVTALPIEHQSISAEPLFETPAVIAMPLGHRLSDLSSLDAGAVSQETWVTVLTGSRLRSESDNILSEAGFAPRVQIEASTTTLATQLVMAGAGLMMTDFLSAQAISQGQLSIARWNPPTLLRSALIFPPTTTQNTLQKEFATVVREVVADVIQNAPVPGTRLL